VTGGLQKIFSANARRRERKTMTQNNDSANLKKSIAPTDFWHDSCSVEEMTRAVELGAVGATSNPTIITNVLKKELPAWKDRLEQLISEEPEWSESEIGWKIYEEVGVMGAQVLLPVFERGDGKQGRMSLQTNPANYRSARAIVEQGLRFHSLAPNINVKMPATAAGIEAMEEATYQGASINATVSFTVPQAIAVAEAVERGLRRREKEGKYVDGMSPICTIMVGRTDDWLKTFANEKGVDINPDHLKWAGVACLKKAYQIFQERDYRARLLVAAFRDPLHWTEAFGGDLALTIPQKLQDEFIQSTSRNQARIQSPVPAEILEDLLRLADFRRAYEEDGMSTAEFDGYGATVFTLRGFITSVHDLQALVRDLMLPYPE
jgi:transaldolase